MARLLAASCAAAAVAAQQLTVLNDYSFKGPFRSFDYDGSRKLDGWRAGGSTEIAEHFVRVTNDRQSKKGWLWSERNWGSLDSWTITLRLRVSGQGKRLFGDGMALWFTTSSAYVPGPAHGFTDTFKGVGVVFDTYVNTDPGHVHKDVLVITSDGTAPKLAPHGGTTDPHPVGCDADFRFWEGRADWNVTRKSVVKLTFRGNRLSISIDPKGVGEWKECVKDVHVAAGSEDWWRGGSWVGITATTGDLADNHDVLSLITTAEDEVAPEVDAAKAPALQSSGNAEVDAAIAAALAREAWLAEERTSQLQHLLEHKLARVEDHIKATLKKFQDQDASMERRLSELEAKLAARISGDVSAKLASVHSSISGAVEAKLTESGLAPGTLAATTRWLTGGLVGVTLLVAALGFAAWRKYKKLMKSHLL